MRRPRAFVVAVAALVAAAAAPAAGAVTFGPCPDYGLPQAGGQCATVTVPLDHSGAVAGTLDTVIERLPARGPSKGIILALSGGPGDAASVTFARESDATAALRADHDVVIVDQRGTGRSAPLTCTGALTCGAQLGAAAHLYTTAQFVEDLDAIRSALGADKVMVYGISYGTSVAMAYAVRHPDRVERLLLDSVLDQPLRDDAFGLQRVAAVGAVTRAWCPGRACRGITRDVHADFLAVLRRASRAPIPALDVDAHGHRHKATVGVVDLGLALLTADVDTDLRAELPAALAAARRGDGTLLLHAARAATLSPPVDVRVFSEGLHVGAVCDETAQPWPRGTPPGQRAAAAQRAFAQIPPAAFKPFAPGLVYAASGVDFCVPWPEAPSSLAVTGALPDVPALLVSGDADLRTPLSAALRVAAQLPHAVVLTVAGAAHAATFDDACAQRALRGFADGLPIAPCGVGRPSTYAPLALPRAGLQRRAARALTLRWARSDARARYDAQRARTTSDRFGGLRGGWIVRRGLDLALHDVVVVPGLSLTARTRIAPD